MKATESYNNRDPKWVKILLIGLTVFFFSVFIVLPTLYLLVNAFGQGLEFYFQAITDENALKAIQLTLLTIAIVVPLNSIFGVAAAYAITKFKFPGKSLLVTLIDLPFAVSPVIAGLIFVLLLGKNSPLGGWLDSMGIQIIFNTPGIIIATLFVTFPFVAREMIPLMAAQGREEEEAALTLGARGWTVFWRVTLPNVKWGLLFGVVLCNARAMGEFGAVSVVSGHVEGLNNTIPLHVELLYNGMGQNAMGSAFALASVLVFFALITLVFKTILERQFEKEKQLEKDERHGH